VGIAAYWLLGEDSQAERLYARVETLLECLNEMTDPLPRAVLAAFRSRRASLNLSHGGNNPSNKTILRWCNMAGQYLEDSLTYSSCKQTNSLEHVSSVIYEGQLIIFFCMECVRCALI
jgi:sterol regulatory element-binding transcription factor 1